MRPAGRGWTRRRSRKPMDERRAKAEIANVKAPLYSAARERTGEVELAGAVFGRTGHQGLLFEAVRMQLAKRRAGTAATKTRGLISGGGRKPWRQKGTGRARAGSTRSPLWRHGGTIFGPQPRDYSYSMPKKAWRKALLERLGLKHALIVFGEGEEGFYRAARNLAAHKMLPLGGLNVFDILNYDELLMTEKSARALEARLGER